MQTAPRITVAITVLAALVVACGSEESAEPDAPAEGGESTELSVTELLEQEPTGAVTVQGGLNVIGLEYFGPDGGYWEYEVELCEGLSITGEPGREQVTCEGESVVVPQEVADMDLAWHQADINSRYLDDARVVGRLDRGVFSVSSVEGIETEAPVTQTSEPGTTGVATTIGDDSLPLEQLEGEDLVALRTYVRNTQVIYLPTKDFVGRVQQLRANCAETSLLQQVLDTLSGRGPTAAQDFLQQHSFVCPAEVAELDQQNESDA